MGLQWDCCMAAVLVSCVLLVAATLKAFAAWDGTILSTNSWSPFWLTVLSTQAELFLSLMLCIGLWPRSSWLGALLLFGLFAAVSLFAGVRGYDTCGCFGKLEVHPWVTFAMDVGVLLILWVKRREFLERPGTVLLRPRKLTSWTVH